MCACARRTPIRGPPGLGFPQIGALPPLAVKAESATRVAPAARPIPSTRSGHFRRRYREIHALPCDLRRHPSHGRLGQLELGWTVQLSSLAQRRPTSVARETSRGDENGLLSSAGHLHDKHSRSESDDAAIRLAFRRRLTTSARPSVGPPPQRKATYVKRSSELRALRSADSRYSSLRASSGPTFAARLAGK